MKFAALLFLIAGIFPAYAEDFEGRWPQPAPACISIASLNKWIETSGGAFKNLRIVTGSAIQLLGTVFDRNGDEDAGPNDWSLMMLLDSPLDGGGLILAGHPGEICQYLILSEEDWTDLLFAIQEHRA